MAQFHRLTEQFKALCDHLTKLCYHLNSVPKNQRAPTSFSMGTDFASLLRLLPLDVMVPLQRHLTAVLPSDGRNRPGHAAFPAAAPTVRRFVDKVEILVSLQRPKKVTFIGSDGNSYAFLAKPKEDLRKDSRLMEFASILNRLLAREPESRRRRLYLRTFTVVPLTDDCGLIEWVPRTTGLRNVLTARPLNRLPPFRQPLPPAFPLRFRSGASGCGVVPQ